MRLELSRQSRVPFPSRIDQRSENRPGSLIVIDRPLRVPLYRQHEVIRGGTLDGFDNSILRRVRYRAQSISDDLCGLVVAGVDGKNKNLRG